MPAPCTAATTNPQKVFFSHPGSQMSDSILPAGYVIKTKHVPDAKKQEQRRRMLKQREAEALRRMNEADAENCYRQARADYRDRDVTAAARLAKKAIQLDPGHGACLVFLGDIHSKANQHAEALHYFLLARKQLPLEPWLIYNSALAHARLGQFAEAIRDFDQFLEVTGNGAERRMAQGEEGCPVLCRSVSQESRGPGGGGSLETASARARTCAHRRSPPPPQPTTSRSPAGRSRFSSPSQARIPHESVGSLADYLLLHRLQELRLAQSFEDLICLPTLNGVDTYVYQHETVRKVLRHFKGRALLADEVGLGKTIEACLVLKEYWMRGMVRKALVLTPPGLVSQWKGELLEKFDLVAASPDGAEFRRNPEQFWKQEPLVVASIAMARMEPNAAGDRRRRLGHGDRRRGPLAEESHQRQLEAGRTR